MAAIMRILGWKAQGLRCPDHEISCEDSDGSPYQVSLIQMPNGTGKTTTLTLLRAALSGSAINEGWDRHKILEFKKRDSDQSEGIFEVRLLLNKRRATIVMVFDFENGRVSYNTTHGPGHREGFNPPSDFRRFMNDNFVNFYVFDGELAEHLLDKQYTDAQIVVENLFQMNTFDTMVRKVGEYWEKKTRNAGATEERGLTRRRNRVKDLKKRLATLKRDQAKLQRKREGLDGRLQKKKETYQQEINKVEARSKALSKAESKAETLKSKVREEALDVLEKMRDPHALSAAFANWMLALKDGLDKVKLPESAAREFFEDLAREAECVCGRPIDSETAQAIRVRATQYLGTEDVSLLNSMKSAINDVVGDRPEENENDLDKRMASLANVVKEERDARTDFHALRHEAERTDPAIKTARVDIEKLHEEIGDIDEKLEEFDSKDKTQTDDRTFGIEILEKRLEIAENKLGQITRTLREKAKRDILSGIINKAHEESRRGITTELCDEANKRISELMPNNRISIDQIERNLVLEGQEGGSAGETLSIAYAFLATLFHRADHQLPFVVDSPAGPIDLAVRPRIGEIIPKLSGQFIAFTISSERNKFVEPLKRASNSEIQFVTVFRKGSKEFERAAYQDGDVFETLDGLNVHGELFFNDFQLDEEEAQ